MNEDLMFEGKKFISSKRAASLGGYSQDYVGQLIRGRKLDARKIGRSWFVSEESLITYQNSPNTSISASRENVVLETVTREIVEGIKEIKESSFLKPSVREVVEKIMAGIISLGLIVGGYSITQIKDVRAAQASLRLAGDRMGQAILDSQKGIASALEIVGDAYIGALTDGGAYLSHSATALTRASEDTANIYLAVIEDVGEQIAFAFDSQPSSSTAASIMSGSLETAYETLRPFFKRSKEFFSGLLVPDDQVKEVTEVKEVKEKEVVVQSPNSPVSVVNYYTTTPAASSPMGASYFTTELANLRASLESQVYQAQYTADRALGSSRASVDRSSARTDYSGNITTSGSITAGTFFGDGSQLTGIGGAIDSTDELDEGTTNLYYSDSRVGNYITASSSLFSAVNYWTKTGPNLSYTGDVDITGDLRVNGNTYITGGGILNVGDKIIAPGEIGLGTSTPSAKLAIQNTLADQVAFLIYGTSTQSAPLVDIFDNPTSGQSVFHISADGNIGIGVLNPSSQLDVYDTTAPYRAVNITSGSGDAGVRFAGQGSNVFRLQSNGASGFGLFNESSGSFGWLQSNSGNIGIGTTTPGSALSVVGTTTLSGVGGNVASILAPGDLAIKQLVPWAGQSSNFAVDFATINLTSVYGIGFGLNSGGWDMQNGGAFLPRADAYHDIGSPSLRIKNIYSATTTAVSGLFSGNVGIGIITPSNKLDVNGDIGIPYGNSLNVNTPVAYPTILKTGWDGMDYLKLYAPGNNIGVNPVMTLLGTGNVGIGTTTPSAKLAVTGVGTGTGTSFLVANSSNVPRLSVQDNGDVRISKSDAGGTLSIATNAAPTEVINIGSSAPGIFFGNTSDSGFKSTIKLNYSNENALRITIGGSDTQIFGASRTGSSVFFPNGNIGVGTTTPVAKFSVTGSGTGTGLLAQFADSSNTPRMTILDNGNVGIGTANPSTALDVAGYMTVSSEIFAQSNIRLQSTNKIYFVQNGVWSDQGSITNPSANTVSINTNLVVPGNVGIGTTTPSNKLDVNGTIGANDIVLSGSTNVAYAPGTAYATNGAKGVQIGYWSSITKDDDTDQSMVLNANGQVLRLGTSGATFYRPITAATSTFSGNVRFSNLGAGALEADASGNITSGSDERLKNIQGTFTRSIADLKKINPITYKWNATSGLDTVNSYSGFSAQNVLGAIPEAVSTSPGGYLSLTDRPILAAAVNALNTYGSVIDIEKAGTTTPAVTIDEVGNIGIGTTTPAYKLQVLGDVAAQSFINISTRNSKKDISYFTDVDKTNALDALKNIGIATYRYNNEKDSDPLHLGLIAEEAPVEVLAANGKGVDVYKLSTFILAGVQELQKKLETAENRLNALALDFTALADRLTASIADVGSRLVTLEEAVALIKQTPATVINQVTATSESIVISMTSWFDSMGVAISEGVARFVAVIADAVTTKSLTVGDADNLAAAGVTLLDRATGEPVCMYVENGEMKSAAGKCGTVVVASEPIVEVESVEVIEPVILTEEPPVVVEEPVVVEPTEEVEPASPEVSLEEPSVAPELPQSEGDMLE